MSAARVGHVDIARLRELLSERDEAVIRHVSLLRLLCAQQIQTLLFPAEKHASPATAARCCRRVLERLTRERLLMRLERRVGGVRAGSSSFVYAIGPVGQRLLGVWPPRRQTVEPSARFAQHTLAVADLLVALTVQARAGGFDLVEWQSEPACWREVVTLGGQVPLRPDLFVVLAVAGYELRWFIELDRGSEHLPAVRRKLRLYNSYYKSGAEQRKHDVFPRVLWIAPSPSRAALLQRALDTDARLAPGLFQVVTGEQAIDRLTEVEA